MNTRNGPSRHVHWHVAASLSIFAAACGNPSIGVPGKETPTLPGGLHLGWNEIDPGGETVCARGGPYAFWVRPGTVDKVIIEFGGGGACWNERTCSPSAHLFQDSVDGVRQAVETSYDDGLYDHERTDNPFEDWYHVLIPYCTGDLHWGDAVTTYGEGTPGEMTIRHEGAINARAALAWVYEQFSRPDQILVTGCSAGSYGSALWSADVARHYPRSAVFQLGDSGAGVITADFYRESFPSWNAEAAFPKDIPELDPSKIGQRAPGLADLYAGVAKHYPALWMSQYNTIRDKEQTAYFELMGGSGAGEWSREMLASVDDIEARAPNFASFVAPGDQHCILLYDNFYTVEADGVKLVDWLRDRIRGIRVRSVRCKGVECDRPTP